MPSSVVTTMTGAQLASSIAYANAQVASMTPAQAASALGATTNGVVPAFGGTWLGFQFTGNGQATAVSLEAQYASQTWDYYRTAAAAAGITSFGAAAAYAKTWAAGVLFGTGEGLAATGGLLSLSAPAAVAALAPLLGAGIGASLYSMNPELWTKISQAILPWCYEDTEVVPAAVDEDGQVYLPKDMLDALRELFDEEGIYPGVTEGITSDLTIPNATLPLKFGADCSISATDMGGQRTITETAIGRAACFRTSAGSGTVYWLAVAEQSGSVEYLLTTNSYTGRVNISSTTASTQYTHNGKTVYYGLVTATGHSSYRGTYNPITSAENWDKIAWTLMYGTLVGGDLPEGLTNWTGIIPQTFPEIWIVVEPEIDPSHPGTMVPYTPVQLPEVQFPDDPSRYPAPSENPDEPYPWESPDPEERPNPQAPTPWPWISPWIIPEIPWQWPWELDDPEPRIDPDTGESTDPTRAPIPDPTQRLEPDINTERDPQQEPSPTQEPENPWDDIPPSEGETPPIAFPPLPNFDDLPMSDVSGLIHVYNPTPAEMQAFGRWVWVTIQDAITQGQELIWNNPFDGVISAHEIYCTPPTGASQYIRSGFLVSDVSAEVVTPRYTSINCGSIVIPEYWRNYLDYSPYTRVYAYLPFIGIVELDCDDIIGHAVNILYHIDTYSGACIAQITVAKEGPSGEDYCNTNYQFSGNCAVEIPLAGGTQAAIRAAQINANAWGLGSVITGIAQAVSNPATGIATGIGTAITGVMEARASVVSAKSSVQHSGAFGESFGAMGIKTPYFIVRRPIQKVVNNYNKDYGFPAHKMVQIGSCTGYLRVLEVNVISATANDTEKQMIELALKNGVYVS